MPGVNVAQAALFPTLTAQFPATRYQGSKAKLVDWIWGQIEELEFTTCLDAFGGTGAVAYRLKQAGKSVTYNDALRFNHLIGQALIENNSTRLSIDDIEWLLTRHTRLHYPHFVQDTFQDIYFTDEENEWLDQTITNIFQLQDRFKLALAFFALCQACIIKRPYNLFHRKNLYIRFADVERSFGNKTSWDKPFDYWFNHFALEANGAIFDNGHSHQALNLDIYQLPTQFDLVYIDPPYISSKGVAVDYQGFYHFLEGLTLYDEWQQHIDYTSKHRRLKIQASPWLDKRLVHGAFDALFQKFQQAILVVSYRSDGIPSEDELVALLKRYKKTVEVRHYGQYKYALSTNSDSREVLLIGR